MKNVKKSAVIISALLLVCAILFTGCPNASGGAKPPADSAGSSGGSSGGTGSGGGSGGSGSGGSGGGSGGGSSGGSGGGSSGGGAGGTVCLTIKGDERITIASPDFIDVNTGKTWAQVKDEAALKVSLQSKWPAEEYGVYEWRVTDENGAPLADGYIFTENTTVYAVTNFKAFKIENGVVKGYTGDKPKGKIIIPDGIIEITKDAFYKCEELTQVRFPKSLKKIENGENYGGGAYNGTFGGCTQLHTADFSACTELTEIGSNSFRDCTGLKKVNLPENLQAIGDRSFQRCAKLEEVKLPENLKTIGKFAFLGCEGLTEVKFPANLQKIDMYAFYKCTGLTELKFPANLKEIEEAAFSGCTALTGRLNLPSSLHTIGKNAFYECTGLTGTLNLPSGLHTIGKWTFHRCKGLTEVKFPAELHTIGEFAFSECDGLTEVKFPANLQTIDTYAFWECKGLTEVEFPANLQKIDKHAFQFCTEVTLFDFSSCTTKLTEIGSDAFWSCNKARFRVPKGIAGAAIKQELIKSGVAAGKIEEIN